MTVRVLVDTSYLARGPSGVGVYIERLLRALDDEGAVEVMAVRQRRRLAPGAGNPVRSAANAVLDALWLHVGLPRAARLQGADVVHHPLPAHSRRIPVPQVSTVHDVAFAHLADRYDRAWRTVAARAYRAAARHDDVLVCVSEATAADAVGVLGADPARIVVAPHGPGQVEPGTPTSALPADGHLLFVGDAEPRKNLGGLLAGYAGYRAGSEDPAPLVLAGSSAVAAGGAPGVSGQPAPTGAELVELLRGARALVHPSLHEGFGLTLLEAMALGVPVVAVDSEGAREVCGDAALLVAPEGLAGAIARVAADAELRADLAQRGLERAAAFSWAASARAHERAYTLALGATDRAALS
jgi:glycosyltransferase involved in cell wall biosynthesis